MKESDKYHKWIEWSEEDQVYIGKCPDLITGIHGEDPTTLYGDLCDVIEDVLEHFRLQGRFAPPPQIRPMQKVA
uniref:Pilus assembly protein HicB n=1 Tax=Candidatus Kentrum sp. LPFa TaxID=2126335 RepID=A0A450XUN6_9GAMM|nr:MAG: hypothetical protein BECKLPF1236A_GA0070988_102037 [Candidatus Kentron sp. LPFa]VFK33021.1 MAG: hypothetical protein BECKLPF1236C_GA0070990_101897 [Candidatus Kentron sp. LPFa]